MKSFFRKARLGFTLMEVNLAILIMAGGVLAMVSLYPLAFSESRQSSDDIAAAAFADGVLAPLTAALSSPTIKWSDWRNAIPTSEPQSGLPSVRGWLEYCQKQGNRKNISTYYVAKSKSQLKSVAEGVVGDLLSGVGVTGDDNPRQGISSIISRFQSDHGLVPVIVATYGTTKNQFGELRIDRSRIIICMRVVRRPFMLFAQPIYYTEVHFQGDPNS